jgi:hypothetical protein
MQYEIEILNRLEQIEAKLDSLAGQPAVQDYYGVAEFANRVDREEFTVREWCRLGRIDAEKRNCGRGKSQEWKISHEELLRYLSDGLLSSSTIAARRQEGRA